MNIYAPVANKQRKANEERQISWGPSDDLSQFTTEIYIPLSNDGCHASEPNPNAQTTKSKIVQAACEHLCCSLWASQIPFAFGRRVRRLRTFPRPFSRVCSTFQTTTTSQVGAEPPRSQAPVVHTCVGPSKSRSLLTNVPGLPDPVHLQCGMRWASQIPVAPFMRAEPPRSHAASNDFQSEIFLWNFFCNFRTCSFPFNTAVYL